MSACEKCWADAGGDPGLYRVLMRERLRKHCTPEEQAGPDAKECPTCKRMTLHQHTGECMYGCSALDSTHERAGVHTNGDPL